MITHTRLEAGEGMADGHDVRRMEDEEDFLGDERQSEDEGEGEDLFGENMADDYVQNEELDRYDPTMLDDYVRTYSYGRIVRRWTHAMSNTTPKASAVISDGTAFSTFIVSVSKST